MSDDPATHHVLVVDDDPGLLRAIAITLRTHGWKVSTATSGGAQTVKPIRAPDRSTRWASARA